MAKSRLEWLISPNWNVSLLYTRDAEIEQTFSQLRYFSKIESRGTIEILSYHK